MPIIVWLGVMYSAKYVNKTYIIEDSQKIINLATIYMVVLAGAFQLATISKTGFGPIFMLGVIRVALMSFVFYVSSKKYIQNTKMESIEATEGVDNNKQEAAKQSSLKNPSVDDSSSAQN
ncbi:hypothetical protein ACFL2R_00900 [Patescibacteria group bacterium]